MKRAFLRALAARRAVIKHLWKTTLQQAPVHTPLAKPSILAFMMDESLDLLLSTDRLPPADFDGQPMRILTPDTHACLCGLNPYVAYFLAGESALVGAIRQIKPQPGLTEHDILASETELLFIFRVLAHREVNAFCEICQIQFPASASAHPYGALPEFCPFKTALANAATAAAAEKTTPPD